MRDPAATYAARRRWTRRQLSLGRCRCGRTPRAGRKTCDRCAARGRAYRIAHPPPPGRGFRVPHHCGACDRRGHNVRTCPDPRARAA